MSGADITIEELNDIFEELVTFLTKAKRLEQSKTNSWSLFTEIKIRLR